MNVSDFIFDFLIKKGVSDAFVVTGGQAMYLNDAMARRPELRPVFMHHEQACGMSADAYSRSSGKLGLAVVTAGPGSVNIVNGLVGGWCDSAPMMVISGQSAYRCVEYQGQSGIRQYGIQGIYIRPFVEKGTKFFVTVDDPSKIQYYMEKAYQLATTGRPGPVWVDVPLDVQAMEVPENILSSFAFCREEIPVPRQSHMNAVITMLAEARRPLLIAGQGVKLAHCQEQFVRLAENLRIPVITTRLGIDVIESDHPLYVGRPGNYGERSANIAVQNADLILSIGSRLSTASIGHNAQEFGKHARKIVVDIDPKELDKPIFPIDLKINDDARLFVEELLHADVAMQDTTDWIAHCHSWKEKYPVVEPHYAQDDGINSYYFTSVLCQKAGSDDVVVVDTGSCFHVACQAWKVKQGQSFLTTGGLSSMGWWVAGIGACVGHHRKNTIVITGDGSLQMNIQEFATIRHNNFPIKVFIYNNNGYLLIRQTQKNFMEGRLFGESAKTGVWCPDSIKIAEAYGIKGVRITSKTEIQPKIEEVLAYDGPVICDIAMPEWQLIIPRVSSDKLPDGTLISHDFDDMFPYLPPEELAKNRLVK